MVGRTNGNAGTVINNMLPIEKIGSITHSRVAENKGTWIDQNWSFDGLTVGAVYIIFIDLAVGNIYQSATIEGETLYLNTVMGIIGSRYSYTFRATKTSITVNTRWFRQADSNWCDSTVSIFG